MQAGSQPRAHLQSRGQPLRFRAVFSSFLWQKALEEVALSNHSVYKRHALETSEPGVYVAVINPPGALTASAALPVLRQLLLSSLRDPTNTHLTPSKHPSRWAPLNRPQICPRLPARTWTSTQEHVPKQSPVLHPASTKTGIFLLFFSIQGGDSFAEVPASSLGGDLSCRLLIPNTPIII